MDFEQAAGRVQLGRSLAFFGAGFSREAKNIRGRLLKDAGDLADQLAKAAGEVPGLSLKAAAQAYEDARAQPPLSDVIRQTFTTKEITSSQRKISTLPWSQIYTTNYDDVLERGIKETGGAPNSLLVSDPPPRAAGFRSVVHLHGFVDRMKDDEWEQTVVLTDVQYAADLLNRSNWPERFRADASYADSIFFFGYSLRDIDISRLLYQDPALRDKTFFVVGASPDDDTRIILKRYGTVRSLKFASDDPQFWLQYAIASLDSEDFKSAEDHFKSAFGLARRRGGYDPFQIENHHARFLLESRTKTNFWDDVFDAFSEANDIVQRQVRNFREGFYPYRVARLYLPYLECHASKFSAVQLETIKQWCIRILAVSDDAPETVRSSVYWDDARTALQASIDILNEESMLRRK